jgi:hypothetical protein
VVIRKTIRAIQSVEGWLLRRALYGRLWTIELQWYLGIRPLWNKSNLVYILFGREKFYLVYDLCLEYESRARTCMSQNESWLSFQTITSPPQHHISKHATLLSKVKWG